MKPCNHTIYIETCNICRLYRYDARYTNLWRDPVPAGLPTTLYAKIGSTTHTLINDGNFWNGNFGDQSLILHYSTSATWTLTIGSETYSTPQCDPLILNFPNVTISTTP